ncbi:MAG: hydantoinase B/oxoprolinase family protein, partial [Sphingomonadaceae bacterium]|nr:hydantoinase B/oxoprolinase family protein [Sphingomonadaceae bacterium]
PGVNKVLRDDGSEEVLTATDAADMAPGDAFLIETPGGGGYGEG